MPQDRSQASTPQGAEPAVAATEAGEPAKRERHRGGRRNRNHDFRKPDATTPVEGAAAPAAADGATVGEAREPAPQEQRREPHRDNGRRSRERFQGKDRESDRPRSEKPKSDRPQGKFGGGRDHGGRDKGGRDKRDSGPSHRQFATSAPPRERDRPIDPNSPFAKLAALKEQLTANRKDG